MGKEIKRKNIETNHTLEEYNRKYGKYYKSGHLVGFKKEEFDKSIKQHSNVIKTEHLKQETSVVLRNTRKYWFINDKYYPIPHLYEKAYVDFILAKPTTKAAICGGLVVFIGAAVAIPILVNRYYSVTLESNTLEITNTRAQKNRDFVTEIKLKDNVNTLPLTLSSIKMKGEDLRPEHDFLYRIDKTTFTSATLTIPKDKVKGNIHITAEGKYNGFAEDTWETIINILKDGGTKSLKKHYKTNSLVGSYHPIKVGNVETYVVVIGENQDLTRTSNYHKSASLTLAFADPSSILSPTKYYSDTKDYMSYEESAIRSVCKNIYNNIESDVKSSIKPVIKTFPYYDSTFNKTYDKVDDEVFALSLKELGGLETPFTNDKDDELCYDCENSCYQLFNESKMFSYFLKCLIGEDFWTRSCSMQNTSSYEGFYFDIPEEVTERASFKRDSLTSENKKIFIPAFTIGEETSFYSDSWDNVINYANSGLNTLKEVYGLDSFVGQEKYLYLTEGEQSERYRVRVIGENHDALVNNKEKIAALTFEFARPVDNVRTNLYNSNNLYADWSLSNARKELNDKVFNSFDDLIKNSIKEVTKYSSIYNVDQEHRNPGVVKTNDKIFALSYKELGGLDYHQDKKEARIESRMLNKDPFSVEGDTYQYYIDKLATYDFLDDSLNNYSESRIKGYGYNNGSATDMSYMLRSANPTKDPTVAEQSAEGYYVTNNDSKFEVTSQRRDTLSNIVPAFCIGETNKADTFVFEYDSWENICKYSNEGGLEKLKEVYKLDTFIGKEKELEISTPNGYETYRVRVIGENHDVLYNDQTKAAALTYEFTRCISNSVRYAENNTNVWETSDLRARCNNEFINQLPEVVKNNIKSVKKVTSGQTGDVITEEKLFPLSTKELGEGWIIENEVYEFYNFGINPSEEYRGYLASERLKADARLNSYFTRSPYIDGTTNYLVHKIQDGYIQTLRSEELSGLAPAFAI